MSKMITTPPSQNPAGMQYILNAGLQLTSANNASPAASNSKCQPTRKLKASDQILDQACFAIANVPGPHMGPVDKTVITTRERTTGTGQYKSTAPIFFRSVERGKSHRSARKNSDPSSMRRRRSKPAAGRSTDPIPRNGHPTR